LVTFESHSHMLRSSISQSDWSEDSPLLLSKLLRALAANVCFVAVKHLLDELHDLIHWCLVVNQHTEGSHRQIVRQYPLLPGLLALAFAERLLQHLIDATTLLAVRSRHLAQIDMGIANRRDSLDLAITGWHFDANRRADLGAVEIDGNHQLALIDP
jgi:hypothetical protein